jgi:hypothetical protein
LLETISLATGVVEGISAVNLFSLCNQSACSPDDYYSLGSQATLSTLGFLGGSSLLKKSVNGVYNVSGRAGQVISGKIDDIAANLPGSQGGYLHAGTNSTLVTKKPKVSNPKLRNTVDELYRENAKIGSGSTADAIREEAITGNPVGGKRHRIKGTQRIANLQRILRTQDLNEHDSAVAKSLLQDLIDALNGK